MQMLEGDLSNTSPASTATRPINGAAAPLNGAASGPAVATAEIRARVNRVALRAELKSMLRRAASDGDEDNGGDILRQLDEVLKEVQAEVSERHLKALVEKEFNAALREARAELRAEGALAPNAASTAWTKKQIPITAADTLFTPGASADAAAGEASALAVSKAQQLADAETRLRRAEEATRVAAKGPAQQQQQQQQQQLAAAEAAAAEAAAALDPMELVRRRLLAQAEPGSLLGLREEVAILERELHALQGSARGPDERVIRGVRFSREGKTRAAARPAGAAAGAGGSGSEAAPARDLLLFLPGVDGLAIEAAKQFDPLSETFDTWCLTVPGDDRSEFSDLSAAVGTFLEAAGASAERPAILVGASFGGLLALQVAQEKPELVKGLALVNPATSYARSYWPVLGMLLTLAPSPALFTVATVAALVTLLPDTAKAVHYIEDFMALPPTARPSVVADGTKEWLLLLRGLFDEVSAASLRWRLSHWLQPGSESVNARLGSVQVPVVVIAGSEDRMLPSVDEANRLEAALPFCEATVVENVGHAALLDPEVVNLREMLLSSAVCDDAALAALRSRKGSGSGNSAATTTAAAGPGGNDTAPAKAYDPVEDFVFDPESAEVKQAVERGELLEKLTSPVFLSVTADGKIVHGLGGVPAEMEGRPLLFVGNHQLLGADLPLLLGRMYREKGILPRGLAHPIAFANRGGGTGGGNGSGAGAGGSRGGAAGGGAAAAAGGRGVADVAASTIDDMLQLSQRGVDLQAMAVALNRVGDAADRTGFGGPVPDGSLGALGGAALRAVAGLAGQIEGGAVRSVPGVGAAMEGLRETLRKAAAGAGGGAGGGGAGGGLGDAFSAFGAVPVSPRNFYRLLKRGDSVLLFPGGAREALHGKGEAYQVFWPDESEFVRTAVALNAVIVPFSAIGGADSAEILLDAKELKSLPFGIGERFRLVDDMMPNARTAASGARATAAAAAAARSGAGAAPAAAAGPRNESVLMPVARPKLPARHYFLFHAPLETAGVDKADTAACDALYQYAKAAVADGIDALLEAREQDPYRAAGPRLFYEAAMGEQAPTFPLQALPLEALTGRPVAAKAAEAAAAPASKSESGDKAAAARGDKWASWRQRQERKRAGGG